MSSIQEIEAAVKTLSREDLAQFRDWFENFDADAWDRQLEEDFAAGRLDGFIAQAEEQIRNGQYSDL